MNNRLWQLAFSKILTNNCERHNIRLYIQPLAVTEKQTTPVASMPPKRTGTSVTRRGRGRATRGRGNAHARVLSDTVEETESQSSSNAPVATKAPPRARSRGSSKKRSFDEAQVEPDAADAVYGSQRGTRDGAAKRAKTSHDAPPAAGDGKPALCEPSFQAQEAAPYVPTPALLYFITMGNLDTSPETKSITLDLVKLTLQPENWHAGLSGMLQPGASFLVASLLTRRQNLVEDVVAALELFGIGYEELVEAYGLLWEWRANIVAVVGDFADNVDGLPAPDLLLAGNDKVQEVVPAEDAADEAWDIWDEAAAEEERPEPEREAIDT